MYARLISASLNPPPTEIFPQAGFEHFFSRSRFQFPFLEKVRGLGDMQVHVPLWFNIASRLFVYVVLGYLFSVCIAIGILVTIATFGLHK